jgi:hypothetical protein
MWTQGVEQDRSCPIIPTQSTFPFEWTYLASLRKFIEDCDEDEEPVRAGKLEQWFGFPTDIPDLRSRRERTNTRKEGKEQCYFARLERGEIPRIY